MLQSPSEAILSKNETKPLALTKANINPRDHTKRLALQPQSHGAYNSVGETIPTDTAIIYKK